MKLDGFSGSIIDMITIEKNKIYKFRPYITSDNLVTVGTNYDLSYNSYIPVSLILLEKDQTNFYGNIINHPLFEEGANFIICKVHSFEKSVSLSIVRIYNDENLKFL